jgi:hypothetical protein
MNTSQIYTCSPSNQTTDSGLGGQDTITLSSVTAPTFSIDTIDLSMLNNSNTVLGSPYTVTTGMTGGFAPGTGWTTSGNTPWVTQSNTAPKINLDGEGADIVVNGASLVEAINSIKDRLNCLQINPELEKEWEELRELGDQYRELERQILEKQATWDRLKAMPKVDVD